jgi:hypothetical protein
MTTSVIQNSCVAGVMKALMASKYVGSFTATDYANIVLTARAIADEFIVENTASGSPIADGDDAQIGPLVTQVAAATIFESGATSIKPDDYASYAKQIYAASKEGLTKLIGYTVPVVPLLTSANYAVLAKSGITNTGTSNIGSVVSPANMGVSPIASTAITGFALSLDSGGAFSTSSQVHGGGKIYAANYVAPTPANLTQAVLDMQAAYTNAAGRAPNFTEYHSGLLNGDVLTPGVYKWSTGVAISGSITLLGDSSSVFVFEIAGVLSLAAAQSIVLSGGVLPQNVFWQVAGNVAIGAASNFYGIILCATDITLGANAVMFGQCLSQTAVNFNAVTLN